MQDLLKSPNRLLIVLALLAIAASFAGAGIYDGQTPDSRASVVGDKLLQLGLIGVGGAALGLVVEAERDARRREEEDERERRRLEEEDRASRLDLFARVRALHVRVHYAAQLINAHDTPRTYFERTRDLMLVRAELDEVSTEIDVGKVLFDNSKSIRSGLKTMMSFLDKLADEYREWKPTVDKDYARLDKSLTSAIDGFGGLLH